MVQGLPRVEMVYGTSVCFVPVQDELAKQLSQRHLDSQLHGIGERLKTMVKVETEDTEEDMDDGLGWNENIDGEEVMEEVEVEEDRGPFHDVWTKWDMEAVRAAAKEGNEKEVEVVEVGDENEEQEGDDDKMIGGGKSGGKSGGKMEGGVKRVLAPWAKQKKEKEQDWVVKVDQWGGKRFNSGWYHYNGKGYPILVLDEVMVCFSFNDVGPFV